MDTPDSPDGVDSRAPRHLSRFQCVRVDQSRYFWRFLTGNGRALATQPDMSPSLSDAMHDIAMLRRVARQAQAGARLERGTLMRWTLTFRGSVIAVSVSSYRRPVDLDAARDRFVALTAVSNVDPVVAAYRARTSVDVRRPRVVSPEPTP